MSESQKGKCPVMHGANTEVHNDSKNKRELALKMGANILMFAFMQ